MQYFIKRDEKIQGPFTREQLMGFAKAKKIAGADLVGNSAQGPFQELKTVWESIKSPPATPASSEPVVQIIESVPTAPQTSTPVIQERFKTPVINTGGAAPAQPALQTGPPSVPTSASPKGKNKSLLIGGIAGGAGLLVAIVWILVASIKGSGLGSSNGGGTFSSDPALLAEAGKRLQGNWITEIQKTETNKANLLESETSTTTTTHRVLTFRFFPPQNPTKGLYADGYFFRGNGASQRARIDEMYAKKTVSQWLIGGELLAADPKNPDHKQYILKREKEEKSSIEIVAAKKNNDGTFDLKIEWDQPAFIEYRGGTDKTNFYRKETALIRKLAETSNSCEIEWQDGVSKRFKDVEVLTDLPGIAQFTRWEDPNVKLKTTATSTKGSSQNIAIESAFEKIQRDIDRLENGDFTTEEAKALEAIRRELAKGKPQPPKPDVKFETAAESLGRAVFDSIKNNDFEKFKTNAVLTEKEFVLWVDEIENHPEFIKRTQASGKSLKDVKGEMKYDTAFSGGPENVKSSFLEVREAATKDGVNWETAKFLSMDTDHDLKRPWLQKAYMMITLVDGTKKYYLNLDDASYIKPIQSFKLFDNMRWRGTTPQGNSVETTRKPLKKNKKQ